jgi:hypothetical protein
MIGLMRACMHLKVSEALASLERWRSEQAELEVTGSTEKGNTKRLAKVEATEGLSVRMAMSSGLLKIDLTGADFNSDHPMPVQSRHAAHLVCEFKNNDRWAFYALRP